ncbi:hypothetical protein SH412_002798 [Planctellipticum variicoloris]|nr:hypothetical protein SH412_002798 [Planctomycetaceae bacterium SH412]
MPKFVVGARAGQAERRTLQTCEFRTFVNRPVRIPCQVLQTGRQRVLRLLA